MKQKSIIIAFLLLAFGLINGQKKEYHNLDGNKTENVSSAIEYLITEKSAVGSDTLSKKTVYFMSGKKKSEISFLNEYKIGENWEWFENGNIHLKALYLDGQLHGEFITYWPNGVQRRKDTFENGKLIDGNCYDTIGNKLPKYFSYETYPMFPGGEKQLLKFIGENLEYPKNSVQGRVITQFYIEKDGKVTDVRIKESDNHSLDNYALRSVISMPNWIPGTLEGLKVRVKYTLPISFKLE